MIVSLLKNDPGFFLVEIKILKGNNIKVFIDADQGAGIDKLVQYNRSLYKQLEEQEFYPGGDFSLEVSSPGLEEPLKLYRQYLKNIGRYAEILTNDGRQIEGKLLSASELEIVLEEERGKDKFNSRPGKKRELVQHSIPVKMIKTTKIQIKF